MYVRPCCQLVVIACHIWSVVPNCCGFQLAAPTQYVDKHVAMKSRIGINAAALRPRVEMGGGELRHAAAASRCVSIAAAVDAGRLDGQLGGIGGDGSGGRGSEGGVVLMR